MKYINADLIKELMKRSIALQGNCEYTLWLQTVDNYVENLPSIDIDSRGHETMSDKVWCSKCRYLYRDFKYGLSCYRLMDNEPCKYEDRKTEPQPTTDCRQTDCYMCKWLGEVDVCGRCRNRNLFAEADTEPKPKDEPTTQAETQNSNLTFDKRCKGCNHYKLTCDLFSEVCKYEPTTEDCSTVPTSSKMEQVEDEPQK